MPNGCVDWLNHLLIDSAVRYLRIESVISDTLIDARRRLVDSHVVDSACAFVFAPTHISPFARSFSPLRGCSFFASLTCFCAFVLLDRVRFPPCAPFPRLRVGPALKYQ